MVEHVQPYLNEQFYERKLYERTNKRTKQQINEYTTIVYK